MEIQLNTNTPRRVLKATWSVESTDDLLEAFGIFRKDKHLRSKYKGPKKTVKQRNKFMTSFFVGRYNKHILVNRDLSRTQKTIIHKMADEIRKEVDQEVLNNILTMAKYGLSI